MKDSQRGPGFEINYDQISESRRQAARNRANPDGFIPLGDGRHHLATDIAWLMNPGKQNVCRIEGSKMCFYTVDSLHRLLQGKEQPIPSDESSFNIGTIDYIRAWYKPGNPSVKICSDINPEFGENYIEFWTDRLGKRDYTDAFILLYERIKAAQRK